MSDHLCPAKGCKESVPNSQLACREHWFQLPKALRTRIYEEYMPGQTVGTMSDGYRECLEAAEAVWS